jgi:hypothetical protein
LYFKAIFSLAEAIEFLAIGTFSGEKANNKKKKIKSDLILIYTSS